MNQKRLTELIDAAQDRRAQLAAQKGVEYTQGAEDRLANFKRLGMELRISALAVWWVYYKKHQDALLNFILSGREASSEGIEGRIDDMQVYLDLCRGLVAEAKEAVNGESQDARIRVLSKEADAQLARESPRA